MLLLVVELFDELYSGLGPLSASSIRDSLGLDYTAAAAVLLFVPSTVAMVLEPALFVLADRHPRRWFVSGGLVVMATAAFTAAAAEDLLDDMLVVFAVLHMRDDLGFSPVVRSAVVGAGVVGAIAGVMVTERVAARDETRRVLGASSVFCALAYVGWLASPHPWLSGWLFGLVGFFAAPMYPLTIARAYAAWPGHSGGVHAVGHLFTPLTLLAPAAVGLVADDFGLPAALALLLLQPLGVGVLGAVLPED